MITRSPVQPFLLCLFVAITITLTAAWAANSAAAKTVAGAPGVPVGSQDGRFDPPAYIGGWGHQGVGGEGGAGGIGGAGGVNYLGGAAHNGQNGNDGGNGGRGGDGGRGGNGTISTATFTISNYGTIYMGGESGADGLAGPAAAFDAGMGGFGGGAFGGSGTPGQEPFPDPWPGSQQGGYAGATPGGNGGDGTLSGGGGGGGGSIPFIGGGSGGHGGDGVRGDAGLGGDGQVGSDGYYVSDRNWSNHGTLHLGGNGGAGGYGGGGGSAGGGGGGAGEYWGTPLGINGAPGGPGAGGPGGLGGCAGDGALEVQNGGRIENMGLIETILEYDCGSAPSIHVAAGGVLVNSGTIHAPWYLVCPWIDAGGTFVNNNVLSDFLCCSNYGTVRGHGLMPQLVNRGRFEPGDSLGLMTLGEYQEFGTLQIQIGGLDVQNHQYDQVRVTGGGEHSLDLTSTAVLELAFANGFGEDQLRTGDSFDVVMYNPYSRHGEYTFDDHLARLTHGTWTLYYDYPAEPYARSLRVTYTGAEVAVEPMSRPLEFALQEAAPNPATGATALAFEMPRTSLVDLRVFDLRGRVVRTLIDRRSMAAGRYSIPWNGRDENDSRLAAGVYFYRLKADDFVSTRRLILLRN